MRTFELGEVIAERRVTFRLQDGTTQDATVRIGRPVVDDDDDDWDTWLCPYHIEGTNHDRVFATFGVDSMQALLLSVHTIPVELAVYARALGAEILAFGDRDTTFLSGCRTALTYAADAFPEAPAEPDSD